MTELAHGSNVAGLETTATLDERTDEFVVHTPHLGATKWWIGGKLRILLMILRGFVVRLLANLLGIMAAFRSE
jgi:alkylation response protein AidB-like acyl-CoA dehydrogenase